MNNKIVKKVLVLGASGMLGNAILKYFFLETNHIVKGLVRSDKSIKLFPKDLQEMVVSGFDAENISKIEDFITKDVPDIVINCIGMVKQLEESKDPMIILPINSIFPHKLSKLCSKYSIRLIHMSTDCVFSGDKGMYKESDLPDAEDIYGISKRFGEIDDNSSLTIRTSIIGHELNSSRSLINWFLSQENQIKGYSKAIFSGLPTIEVARVIDKFVIPNTGLNGLYHLSADPISKYELLKLVSIIYGKIIDIQIDDTFKIDRSLNSNRFREATGYSPKKWPALVKLMHEYK